MAKLNIEGFPGADDGKAGSQGWIYEQMAKAGPFAILTTLFTFVILSALTAVVGLAGWAVRATVPEIVGAAKEISKTQNDIKECLAGQKQFHEQQSEDSRATREIFRELMGQRERAQSTLEEIRDKLNRVNARPSVNDSSGGGYDATRKPVGTSSSGLSGIAGAGQ